MLSSAAYDSYDYPSYWIGREYEHRSEVIALKNFLAKIPKRGKLIEIGAGFGRLAPIYLPQVEWAVLVDPSGKLLQLASSNLAPSFSNFSITRGQAENLPAQIKEDFDIAVMVRVLHHIENPQVVIKEISKSLKPDGYLIIEFANKIHFKARIRALLRGDFFFSRNRKSLDLSTGPGDIRFLNHHPQKIIGSLQKSGFKIIDKLSVSNFRSIGLEKILPLPLLLLLERIMQKFASPFFFGPSIFVLAKKT